jgi:DNA-binding MarR family transcriptional regulator
MESDGFLKRVRGKDDDRSLSIELTAKGKSLRKKALEINQCIASCVGISDDKIATTIKQLKLGFQGFSLHGLQFLL